MAELSSWNTDCRASQAPEASSVTSAWFCWGRVGLLQRRPHSTENTDSELYCWLTSCLCAGPGDSARVMPPWVTEEVCLLSLSSVLWAWCSARATHRWASWEAHLLPQECKHWLFYFPKIDVTWNLPCWFLSIHFSSIKDFHSDMQPSPHLQSFFIFLNSNSVPTRQ